MPAPIPTTRHSLSIQGTRVEAAQEFRRKYNYTCCDGLQLSTLSEDILYYTGDSQKPEWISDEPGMSVTNWIQVNFLIPSSCVQETLYGHCRYIGIGQNIITSGYPVGDCVHPRLQHHPPLRPNRAQSTSRLGGECAYFQRRWLICVHLKQYFLGDVKTVRNEMHLSSAVLTNKLYSRSEATIVYEDEDEDEDPCSSQSV